MTNTTKHYKKFKNIFRFLDVASLVGPISVFFVIGMTNGAPAQKLTLGITAIGSLVLLAYQEIMKNNIRSVFWIMLIGLLVALQSLEPVLYTMAASTVSDEFIFQPLYKKYKARYIAATTSEKVLSDSEEDIRRMVLEEMQKCKE